MITMMIIKLWLEHQEEYDMITKRLVDTRNLKVLIMDEADEMLSQGFRDQMVKILNGIPMIQSWIIQCYNSSRDD